jgi:hypothetical protein
VEKGFHWPQSLFRVVHKNFRHEVNDVRRGSASEYFNPRVCLDLRELEFSIVGIHGLDLLFGWGAEDFDNFDQLVNSALSGEDGLAKEKLGNDTSD